MTYQSILFALFYSNFSSSYTIPLFFPIFLNTILISFRFLFIFFSIIIAQTTVLHNRHFDTKKAERYFKERGIKFQSVDILSKGLSKGELDSVVKALGGKIDSVIDENSKDYAEIKYLLDSAKPEKLEENPKLYKTPIVRNGRQATVGYCPDVWKNWE